MATFGFEKIKPKPHIINTAVPKPLADVIRSLSGSLNDKVWLVGGTALSAYYFGHRRSDDLDLFAADERSLNMAVAAMRALAKSGLMLKEESRTPLYYHANAINDCHKFTIDIVLDENVHKVGRAVRTGDGISVADLDTLFAMKVATLVSRASEKDLFDLDYMFGLVGHWTVETLITAGRTMDAGLDEETLLISLKGTLLRKEACNFLPAHSTLTLEQAFRKVANLRHKIVDLLVVYGRDSANNALVKSIKASVKDFKR